MRTSAIIPVALVDAANERLQFNTDGSPTGYGPSNFSVPLRSGTEGATHAGLSAGNVAGFLELLLEMEASGDFPGLVVDYEGKEASTTQADFDALTTAEALEWEDPSNWFQNPVMTGDQRTFGGKTWESLTDYNVWQPPVAWREVVAEGYPAWVQPVGSVDAYALDATVTHNGQDWRSDYPANVWEPGVFGWTVI